MRRDYISNLFNPKINCDFCYEKINKIGEGGQSDVYSTNSEKYYVRTISIKKWKNLKNEIIVSYFVSDLTKRICPHFPITYNFTVCKKDKIIHQIIEKFDGHMDKSHIREKENLIQLLLAIYTLMRAGLRHNDIKMNNILYRKVDTKISYKFNKKFYAMNIKTLLVITDFGKCRKYPELKGNFETNPLMNIKDFLNLLDIFGINVQGFRIVNFDEGMHIVKEYIINLLKSFEINYIPENYYNLDSSLPVFSSKNFNECFFKKLIEIDPLL